MSDLKISWESENPGSRRKLDLQIPIVLFGVADNRFFQLEGIASGITNLITKKPDNEESPKEKKGLFGRKKKGSTTSAEEKITAGTGLLLLSAMCLNALGKD